MRATNHKHYGSESKNITVSKKRKGFKAFSFVFAITLAATVLVCEVPFLAAAFGFTPVGIKAFAIAAVLGVCVIPIVEIVKLFQRLFAKKNG